MDFSYYIFPFFAQTTTVWQKVMGAWCYITSYCRVPIQMPFNAIIGIDQPQHSIAALLNREMQHFWRVFWVTPAAPLYAGKIVIWLSGPNRIRMNREKSHLMFISRSITVDQQNLIIWFARSSCLLAAFVSFKLPFRNGTKRKANNDRLIRVEWPERLVASMRR